MAFAFPVSGLLRAVPVIREKKNKHGPLTTVEDKHSSTESTGKSFLTFSHTLPSRSDSHFSAVVA